MKFLNPKNTRTAAVGFIFVTILIDSIGFGIVIPVLPNLIVELTGDSIGQASSHGGFLMFAYSLVQFVCAPFVGALSDRFGRRPVLLAALFGFTLDYLFLTFAPTLFFLFVGRIIAGIMGASFTTASAYIADITPAEKRAESFGLIGVAFGLGFIIGPLVGGLLGQFGSRIPFLAAAILTFVNFLFGFFILPESLSQENRRAFEWKNANPLGALYNLKRYPLILPLVFVFFLVSIGSHSVQSNWAFYVIERFKWDEKMIGISLAVVGVLIAIVQGGLMGISMKKLGAKNSVYLGTALFSIGYALYAMANASWMMFAFSIPYCLGGISGPALQGIVSSHVPANEQGELQGTLTSLMSVTSIFGPLLMTSVFTYFTTGGGIYLPGAPMWLSAVITLIALAVAYFTLEKETEETTKTTA
ncbi:TCR/Tet family MFS transporter [Leptospira idonii]|uniref:MFS transporter n=1 Tax=Leptospira idonii TaxID=1193500 RepID=A0A4R9LZ52_9LEPT|nr:TCR/Tet family MFS transporter [Leptospira idonii]TGN19633.1 MFS transporter [Leptospira idonii]